MALTSLVVCADATAVQVLSQIFRELEIGVEHSEQLSAAASRLAAQRFDAVVVDCQDQLAALEFLTAARRSVLNKNSLIIGLVEGREQVGAVFAGGANFIVYKPVTVERAAGSLRAARGLMRREKRVNLRVGLHTPASIAYGNADNVPAFLLDLSESGLSMQSGCRLPSRCKVYFQFTLPDNRATIRLSGEVVWQDASGRVGIRFADVPQASRRALSEWIKTALARQAAAELQVARAPQPIPPEPFPGKGGQGLLVSSSNRRERSRQACRLGADVYRVGESVPYRCTLSDISTGGCYVESTAPFSLGTHVEIIVRTEQLKLRVRGTVQTVHRGFGMGVQFNLSTVHEREQVRQLIACQANETTV